MDENINIKLKIRFYEILEMDDMTCADVDELFLIKSILESEDLLNTELIERLAAIKWEGR